MQQLLKHKENLTRMFFILVGFFVFQSSFVSVLASPINLGLNLYSPISVSHIYDEFESSVWLKNGHISKVNWVLSKSGIGQKYEVILYESRVVAKGSGNVLRHYTSKAGYNAIMKSKTLNPSIGLKNARHGSGQYLTDLASEGLTSGQVSRQLFGVPWNGRKVSHYIDIDVGGLNVIKNAPGNYLVPGTNRLPLGGRIINSGTTIFK